MTIEALAALMLVLTTVIQGASVLMSYRLGRQRQDLELRHDLDAGPSVTEQVRQLRLDHDRRWELHDREHARAEETQMKANEQTVRSLDKLHENASDFARLQQVMLGKIYERLTKAEVQLQELFRAVERCPLRFGAKSPPRDPRQPD